MSRSEQLTEATYTIPEAEERHMQEIDNQAVHFHRKKLSRTVDLLMRDAELLSPYDRHRLAERLIELNFKR